MSQQQTMDRPSHADRTPVAAAIAIGRRRATDGLVIGVLIVVSTVLAALAEFSNPPADAWLWRMFRQWTMFEWIPAIDVGWSVAVGILLVGTAVVVGWSCRALRVVIGAAVLVALGVGGILSVLVNRDPPPLRELAGQSIAFPSTSLLIVTVAAGMLVLAFDATDRRRFVRDVVASALGVGIALLGLGELSAGERWPIDVVVALTIGVTIVLGARVALDEPRWHGRCGSCQWRDLVGLEAAAAPKSITVDRQRARTLEMITLVWSGVVLLGFGVLTYLRGIPRTPDSGPMGSGLELPLAWGLPILIVVGVLVARRWHLAGSIIAAVGAVGLGYACSVEYAPWIAVTVTVVAFLPALLLWLEWRRRVSLRAVLSLAAVIALVLGCVVAVGASTYSTYWGPTHPVSFTAPPNTDTVEWIWAGATTATSVTVRARLADDAVAVRLVVSNQADLGAPVTSEAMPALDSTNLRIVSLTADGLTPNTQYFYGLDVDGVLARDRTGTFRTFPDGAANFTFAVSGDALTGSNGQVFDAIRAADPLFFVSPGDFFYGNVDRDDPGRFRAQYEQNLRSPAQAALYASTSFAYTWGDHDFAGNDADRTAVAAAAAHDVYRQYVPHYPLALGSEEVIAQAFTVGRVRVIITDNRSARDPASTEPRSMLGSEQLQWLLTELEQADNYGAVVWVNADPWVATADPASDTWGGFAAERQIIADAIADDHVTNLLMVSGDAHMLAFDDGTNTDYSLSGGAGFLLLHAAALDREPSVKGGPYSGPVIPGTGQFATVQIRDNGTAVSAVLVGWNWKGERLVTTQIGLS